MDALHRVILGLALALAHIGGWHTVGASSVADPCACAASGSLCVCVDCVCKAEPEPSEPAPDQDDAAPSPETPRVPGPDRIGAAAWSDPQPPPVHGAASATNAHGWAGTSPFAFWCVWRT